MPAWKRVKGTIEGGEGPPRQMGEGAMVWWEVERRRRCSQKMGQGGQRHCQDRRTSASRIQRKFGSGPVSCSDPRFLQTDSSSLSFRIFDIPHPCSNRLLTTPLNLRLHPPVTGITQVVSNSERRAAADAAQDAMRRIDARVLEAREREQSGASDVLAREVVRLGCRSAPLL